MIYRHDPRLVRMNFADNTLHCEVHGLLSGPEADDVLQRSGLTSRQVETSGRPTGWLRVLNILVRRMGHPRCEPIQ